MLSVPTRTDTTLLGPCDGKWCYVFMSANYPPSPDDLYLLSWSSTLSGLVGVKMYPNNTATLSYGGLGVPACVVPSETAFNSDGTVSSSLAIYTAPNSDFYQGVLVNGVVSSNDQPSTLTPAIPYSWTSNAVMSSVGYRYNSTLATVACSNPYQSNCYLYGTGPLSSLSSCYFYFFPGITFSKNLDIPIDDQNWAKQYRQRPLPSTFTLPYQASIFYGAVMYQIYTSASLGYTDSPTALKYGNLGMVFYSTGPCGASVQFTGLYGTPQSGSTSVGMCDSGNCRLDKTQFQCSGKSSGGGTTDNGPNLVPWIVAFAIIIIVIVAVILIALTLTKK